MPDAGSRAAAVVVAALVPPRAAGRLVPLLPSGGTAALVAQLPVAYLARAAATLSPAAAAEVVGGLAEDRVAAVAVHLLATRDVPTVTHLVRALSSDELVRVLDAATTLLQRDEEARARVRSLRGPELGPLASVFSQPAAVRAAFGRLSMTALEL